MGKTRDNKKVSGCQEFRVGERRRMNKGSAGDFHGGETILYDTIMVDS